MKYLTLAILLMFIAIRPVQASEPLSPVRTAELRIRNERLEHTIVFDKYGTILGESTGTATRVNAPDVRLYGTTVLHNHPGGNPFFSALDVRFAAYNNVQRSIVITPVVLGREKAYIECVMDRGEAKYWPGNIYEHYDTDATHPESFAVLSKRTSNEPIHPIWWDYFRRYSIDYRCEVLPQ